MAHRADNQPSFQGSGPAWTARQAPEPTLDPGRFTSNTQRVCELLDDGDSSANEVNAEPTRQFFVDVLTRDISLQDTILDLIDNCHDGILRSARPHALSESKPYKGYHAKLILSEEWFSIDDNCGGIDPITARTKAFRMGRELSADDQDRGLPTVGVYGIGMKRAIFKIGRAAIITSQYSASDSLEVTIPQNWVTMKGRWSFPIQQKGKVLEQPGTQIMISPLTAAAGEEFSNRTNFVDDLKDAIRRQYALIIDKGFEISVNGETLLAAPMQFLAPADFSPDGIAPYVITGTIDDISVDLICGFYRPLANESELDDETTVRRSRDDAGWTIICNERVVVYKDRSRLTGWGMGLVPSYHNQFISIAGVVYLTSNDPVKLPLTTTKRGIDASSDVYLIVLKHMMEGVKHFTDFTNRWKGSESAMNDAFNAAISISPELALDAVKRRGDLPSVSV